MIHFDPEKEVIENPTWLEHIQYLFTEADIKGMKDAGRRTKLDNYDSVSNKSKNILNRVKKLKGSSGVMPPPKENRYWSETRVATFKNWRTHGHKFGQPTTHEAIKSQFGAQSTTRIRKEIRALDEGEIKLLKKAFLGIMNLPATEAYSYFALAGIHGFPAKEGNWHKVCNYSYCEHNAPKYHLWHRAYLYNFENALRSIDGCQNVTLPYWDFENTESFPAILTEAPFDNYTLPFELSEKYQKGYETKTNKVDNQTILDRYKTHVAPRVVKARTEKTWDGFRKYVIEAHDYGHVSFGFNAEGSSSAPFDDGKDSTMKDSRVASFDPIFWIFHCNWDRLWWEWQGKMKATTAKKMIPFIIDEGKEGLALPFDEDSDREDKDLPPFSGEEVQDPHIISILGPEIVDSVNQLDVDYKHIEKPMMVNELTFLAKGSSINKNSLVIDSQNVSIRIKGVNRIRIDGSFFIVLIGKDNNGKETIDSKAFFQFTDPEKCKNCVKHAIVNFDFLVPISQIKDKELSVEIVSSSTNDAHEDALENVTINARLLMIQE